MKAPKRKKTLKQRKLILKKRKHTKKKRTMKKKPRKPSIKKSVSNASIHHVYIARGGYTTPSLGKQIESLKQLEGFNLENQRKNIISAIIQTLYGKLDPQIKKEIVHLINTHKDLRSINNDIDNFIERIETVIQDFVQTSITSSFKVITAAVPGVSILGALLTSTINWTVWVLKIRYNYLEWKNISDTIKGKMAERMPNLKAKEEESSNTKSPTGLENIFNESLKRNMKQVTEKAEGLKTDAIAKATEKMNELKSKATEKMNELKSKATEKMNELKSTATEKMNEANTAAMAKTTEKMNEAKTAATKKADELTSKATAEVNAKINEANTAASAKV